MAQLGNLSWVLTGTPAILPMVRPCIFCVPLGFDLCEVGQEEVILKTGKQASRRTTHFALQSLLSLFGKLLPCPPPGELSDASVFWKRGPQSS